MVAVSRGLTGMSSRLRPAGSGSTRVSAKPSSATPAVSSSVPRRPRESFRIGKRKTDPTSGGGGDLFGGTVYGGGHVPMIVVAAGVGHRVNSVFADHYSLLQTIEQNFGLPLLGDAGDTVQVSSLAPLLH